MEWQENGMLILKSNGLVLKLMSTSISCASCKVIESRSRADWPGADPAGNWCGPRWQGRESP